MPMPLTAVFADRPGPRGETANTRHPPTDILVIATCAVIAGAGGWEDLAGYGRTEEAFLRRFRDPKTGVPGHDALERVFAGLDPDAFADRSGRWTAEACEATGRVHVAIDGQSARRSAKGTFTGCPHRVTAWAVGNRPVPGRRAGPDGGHEITAPPDLLAAPDLHGAVVTPDAAGRQRAAVEQIRRQGGDHVECVEGNREGPHGAAAGVFDRAAEADVAGCGTAAVVGAGQGREEERYVTGVRNPDGLPAGWTGVGAVALACRERRVEGR